MAPCSHRPVGWQMDRRGCDWYSLRLEFSGTLLVCVICSKLERFKFNKFSYRSVNGSFDSPNGVAFSGDEAPDAESVMYVALDSLDSPFALNHARVYCDGHLQLPCCVRTGFDYSSEPWAVGEFCVHLPALM